MERSHHAIKFGKPSISMGHLYHGYVSHNQRVDEMTLGGVFPPLMIINHGLAKSGVDISCTVMSTHLQTWQKKPSFPNREAIGVVRMSRQLDEVNEWVNKMKSGLTNEVVNLSTI